MDPRNPDFWGSIAVQELCEFQPVCPPLLSSPSLIVIVIAIVIVFVVVIVVVHVFKYIFLGVQSNSWILRGALIHMSDAALS